MTRFRDLTLRFTAAALMFTLAGAVGVQAFAQGTPELIFANKTVLNVDATSMDVKIENIPPREYPHVNYRSHVRFEDAARDWAKSHFMLTGNSVNTLQIIIRKGDLVEKLLPVKKGIKGWFTKDQAAEYAATLELDLALIDPNGRVISTASGKSSSTQTVTEGATEDDKQAVWSGMIISAFDALDREFQPQLRQVMAQYIR